MSRTSTKPATKSNVVSIAPPKATKPRAISLEHVINLAPGSQLVENLGRTFGLEPVDFDGIRDALGAQIRASGAVLGEALNERALQIHLQRIVGAHVASAYAAAQFYGTKLSAAKDLTTRLGNDDRDEDRDGPSGFEDKAAVRAASLPKWRCNPTRCAPQPRVPFSPTPKSPARPGKPTKHPCQHPPASAAVPPPKNWPHQTA
jgi:hypothetical protein